MRTRKPQSALGDALREHFSNNVRELRTRKGLTQQQLATGSGLGRAFINQVERGHCSVTLETIGALASALGVRPAVLISRTLERPEVVVVRTARGADSGRTRAGRRG